MIRLSGGGRFVAAGFLTLVISGCGGGSGGAIDSASPDVSGTITIESGTRVDSDTADASRLGLAVPNNTDSTAQVVPDAGVTGGYISATAGSYPPLPDNTFIYQYPVDAQDTFKLSLVDGSRVALQMFPSDDSQANPAVTLSIRNGAGTEYCSASCSGSGSAVLGATVTGGGSTPVLYTVSVTADSGGPARYVLTVTPPMAATARLTAAGYEPVEFVPNEAIVRLDNGSQTAQASASGLVQAFGVATARPLGLGLWQLGRVPKGIARPLSGQALARSRADTLTWIRDLRQRADVGLAEPNYLYRAQQIVPGDDPLYSRQWHYPLINLPIAWQLAPSGGQGVGVAVMDTGLFSMTPDSYGNWHPDLDANVIGPDSGRILDYVTGDLDIDNSPGVRDANPADPGDGQPQASSFHGTHVAGTIAALDNTIGGLGVAPSATLIPVRVLGSNGTGTSADLIDALIWASTQPNIDVINLSLGGLGPSTALRSAIDKAYNQGKGILIVAAAGNRGTDSLTYPAAYPDVVGVGAVDGAAKRASYSNFGGSVDLVAPGGDANRDANLDGNADVVISTWGDDSTGNFVPAYAGLVGTSMAAPHVTGVYALMKSLNSSLTPDGFFALLASGDLTDNVGSQTEYGAGLINAVKAISAAEGTIPTTLVVSPSGLQFRQEAVTERLDLTEYTLNGSAPLSTSSESSLTNVTYPDWLLLDPASASSIQSTGSLAVSLKPGALTRDVRYSGTITIPYATSSQTRTLSVPVTARLGEQAEARNAGRHYVLLVSADSNRTTIVQQEVEAQAGQYGFHFTSVPPGSYFLVAGSDVDNNGYICENGEACAEYPVNGLPESITVGGQPLTGLMLSTSFRRPTVTVMGLPRAGFSGYSLLSPEGTAGAPERRLRSLP